MKKILNTIRFALFRATVNIIALFFLLGPRQDFETGDLSTRNTTGALMIYEPLFKVLKDKYKEYKFYFYDLRRYSLKDLIEKIKG